MKKSEVEKFTLQDFLEAILVTIVILVMVVGAMYLKVYTEEKYDTNPTKSLTSVDSKEFRDFIYSLQPQSKYESFCMKQDSTGTIYVYGSPRFFDDIDNDSVDDFDYRYQLKHEYSITRLKIPKELMEPIEFEDGGFDFVPAIQENDEEVVCLVYFNATLHYGGRKIVINPEYLL